MTIREGVRDIEMNRFNPFSDFNDRKVVVQNLYQQVVGLQEVIIGLDFLIKAVRGDDSIQAGRDFRFHYDNINDAESFRRVRGYFVMVSGRNDFLDDMKKMMEDINESINDSIFTDPEDLIRELSNYAIRLRGKLVNEYDMTVREVDELATLKTSPDRDFEESLGMEREDEL